MKITAINKKEAPEVGRYLTHGGGFGFQAYTEVDWQMLGSGTILSKEGFENRDHHTFDLDIGQSAATIMITNSLDTEGSVGDVIVSLELDEVVIRDQFPGWNPTNFNDLLIPVYYERGGKARLNVTFDRGGTDPITRLDTTVLVYVADLPSKDFRDLTTYPLRIVEES